METLVWEEPKHVPIDPMEFSVWASPGKTYISMTLCWGCIGSEQEWEQGALYKGHQSNPGDGGAADNVARLGSRQDVAGKERRKVEGGFWVLAWWLGKGDWIAKFRRRKRWSGDLLCLRGQLGLSGRKLNSWLRGDVSERELLWGQCLVGVHRSHGVERGHLGACETTGISGDFQYVEGRAAYEERERELPATLDIRRMRVPDARKSSFKKEKKNDGQY